jgi:C4-dicarboxylate-specific signal transduction histidine kinase
MQGLERIQSSVQRVLTFGRPAPAQRQPIRLANVVFQSIEFLRPRARQQQAQISSSIEAPDAQVYADSHALSQMIINLLNNALDSLIGRADGRVELTLALQDETTVLLSIADNGHGVPEHLREKIFDPFFTTKIDGKGTGLGLSVSANIIAEYRGQISVSTRPGGGTIFKVTLPRYEPKPRSSHKATG